MNKILFISRDFPPIGGGQGIYTYELSKRLGDDCSVLTTYSKKRNDKLSVKLYEINYSGGNPILLIFKLFLFFHKKLTKKNYNIIHGNSIDHLLFLMFKKKTIKYITTTHNTYLQRWHAKKKNLFLFFVYPFFIILEYFVLNRSDKIICVSELTKKYVEKMGIKNNIVVIENGVDTELYKPVKKNDSEYNFLYVGRLEQRKRVIETIILFKQFLNSYRGDKVISLYIVGTGPDYEKIKKYILDNNLKNNIFLEGYQSNVKKYYDLCNCILLLSKGEGLPLVILEAMACGLSGIITKDASGKTSFIKKCKSFYIVEDDINNNKDKIQNNFNDVIKLKGNECYVPNWETVILKIKELYKNA